MTNMADHVKLARGISGDWGVYVSRSAPFLPREISDLFSQITLTAHVAEGRNEQEQRERNAKLGSGS